MRGRFLSLAPLDRKLLRDLWHIRGQALAIALVIASGVATLILSLGAYQSLLETRRAYYERYQFADIFASAKRAPNHLREAIAAIPGVAEVETRAVSSVILDIPGIREPATGRLISLPDIGPQRLNRVYLRQGRLPEPLSSQEIAVNEAFASANKFRPGDRLTAIINGRKKELLIVGVLLSPEFIYALGPGDFVPDDRRTGLIWMSYKSVASVLDLDGAFNDVSLKLTSGAVPKDVMARLDAILGPYGGQDAYTRADQQSHAFIEAELNQQRAMAEIIPPIFLAVAAFLLNMTLARLIILEREQIGLLKALGYSSRQIGAYYLKFALIIAVAGILIGFAVGSWAGRLLTQLYAVSFHFPFLVFLMPAKFYALAAIIGLASAAIGALQAVRTVVKLPPAAAMQPPAPTHYSRSWLTRSGIMRAMPQSLLIIGRNIVRFPARSIFTTAGMVSAVALMVVSVFALDAIEFMIDVTYFQSSRQDVALTFNEVKRARAVLDVTQLPGILRAETYRGVPVTLKHGHLEKRLTLIGLPQNTQITKLLDRSLRPVDLPDLGIVLSEKLAEILGVGPGRQVRVEFKSGRRRSVSLPVTGVVESYLGLTAYIDLTALNRLMQDGDVISGVSLRVDEAALPKLYAAVKVTPAVASIALQKESLKSFRATLARNLGTMIWVYIALSATIAFGVVYNSARIQLSERGRELASLRILGFTRGEVMTILFGEIIILLVIAIPLGWVAGYGLAGFIIAGMETELYRIPLVVSRSTYALAAIVSVGSTLVSAGMIRVRIARMDLIAVLKTRE